jgi:hypothetical protein
MKRMNRWIFVAVLTMLLPCVFSVIRAEAATSKHLINGIQWADMNGKPIQAHGGGMIKAGNYYYWFGENRDDTGHFQGISCYRSSDFVRWIYIRDVLTKNSNKELKFCWIERPH